MFACFLLMRNKHDALYLFLIWGGHILIKLLAHTNPISILYDEQNAYPFLMGTACVLVCCKAIDSPAPSPTSPVIFMFFRDTHHLVKKIVLSQTPIKILGWFLSVSCEDIKDTYFYAYFFGIKYHTVYTL